MIFSNWLCIHRQ